MNKLHYCLRHCSVVFKAIIVHILTLVLFVNILHAQQCLPDGISFTTQAQIDSFPINYPGCTEIEGSVEISGGDITDLSGLSDINSIGGNLIFIFCHSLDNLSGLEGLVTVDSTLVFQHNSLLYGFSGLDNLDSIGQGLVILSNSSLIDLSGLGGLTSVGGGVWIEQNYALTSLTGLESLKSVGGSLMILINDALNDLQGLEALTNIGTDLYVSMNNNMSSLTGLENLTSIGRGLRCWSNNSLVEITSLYGLTELGGQLSIRSNEVLRSLHGLDNILPASITDLDIFLNDSLSTCHVQSICDYLLAPNGEVSISYNATGCNNREEVEDSCETLTIHEHKFSLSVTAYPNPFTTSTTIEYELKEVHSIQLTVYSSIGNVVYQIEKQNMAQGKQAITLSLHHLPAGLYYAVLRSEDGVSVVKLIKQ